MCAENLLISMTRSTESFFHSSKNQMKIVFNLLPDLKLLKILKKIPIFIILCNIAAV